MDRREFLQRFQNMAKTTPGSVTKLKAAIVQMAGSRSKQRDITFIPKVADLGEADREILYGLVRDVRGMLGKTQPVARPPSIISPISVPVLDFGSGRPKEMKAEKLIIKFDKYHVANSEDLLTNVKKFPAARAAVAINSVTACGTEKELHQAAPNAYVYAVVKPDQQKFVKAGLSLPTGDKCETGVHYEPLCVGSTDGFFPKNECDFTAVPEGFQVAEFGFGNYVYNYSVLVEAYSTKGIVCSEECKHEGALTSKSLSNRVTAPRQPLNPGGVTVPKLDGEFFCFQAVQCKEHALATCVRVVDRTGNVFKQKCVGLEFVDFNLQLERIGRKYFLLGGVFQGVGILPSKSLHKMIVGCLSDLFFLVTGRSLKVRPFADDKVEVPVDGCVFYSFGDPLWGRKYKPRSAIDFDLSERNYREFLRVVPGDFLIEGFPSDLPGNGVYRVECGLDKGVLSFKGFRKRDDKSKSDAVCDVLNTIVFSY